MQWLRKNIGVLVALTIIVLWFAVLAFQFGWTIDYRHPWTYLAILVMAHLYTGLFITAHDAMHGVVAPKNKRLNKALGFFTAILFAFNWYPKLFPKHHEHHRFVATEEDPDFHRGNPNFFAWYFSFAKQYVSLWQIVAMGVTYELLKRVGGVDRMNLIFYWIVPSLLATFQLFYYGTFLPHRGEHDNKHQSRSQSKNHLWAFLSCYFFGYHYEHHNSPGTPWWLLYKEKEKMVAKQEI
ncbi:MAG: fatty acid desaturase [Bacteroidota bacterium]